MHAFSQASLDELKASTRGHETRLQLPRYERQRAAAGVVHLGLGAFHRAHQAMVFDTLLAQGDARWSVLGVAMRSTALADALEPQDGLYTVQVASAAGRRWQIVGAVQKTCVAAREPQLVIDAIAAPSTRWITLTVTEKAYGPELAALLVKGLAARHAAGLGGLTLASCDNLSGNGHKLRQLCLDAAQHKDAALAAWISARCTFPNSMVDRIVPAATPLHRTDAAAVTGLDDACALGTESFWEWVIERDFADPLDAAALASAGVTVVDDVLPFEQAKLCMLNGSHTAIALMGAVMGLPTVADCVAQPDIHWFVHQLMTGVMMPQLRRPDLPAYRDALLARFANPDLRHKVHQIASDSSLKIPLRWLGTVQARLASGQAVEPLAFASAVWLRYLLAEDEQGQAYAISDPLGETLQALAQQHRGDAAGTVQALLALPSVWGDALPANPQWTSRLNFWLERIQSVGVAAALSQLRAAETTSR
ncbi:mannitol dehydrogenase family protein [Polaromonas sp. OV174]|uniref:mannitol dehydrogenase family protein n=1 Tax=Polaromonas sp. OV174 TaxID=1855300 RepID=UPI000B80E852|nr:mannitol dehydrogenase family protein [Polaromonas sp. OV174]